MINNYSLRQRYRQHIDKVWNSNADYSELLAIKNEILKIELNESRKFYRYKSFIDWDDERFNSELEDIKDGKITLVHPNMFNDPYDCRLSAELMLRYMKLERSDLYKFKRKIKEVAKNDPGARGMPRNARRVVINNVFNSQVKKRSIEDAKQTVENNKKLFRVACFATKFDDMYFWSHYGSAHKGYCVEYGFGDESFKFMHPVEYTEKMPEFKLKSNKHSIALLKSIDWSRENEWRLVDLNNANDKNYDDQIKKCKLSDVRISAIYLGLDFYKKSDDSIIEARKSSLIKCFGSQNIFEMSLKDDEFRLCVGDKIRQ